MFSIETWQFILNGIDDPIELIKLRAVCKNWSELVNKILARSSKWDTICRKLVPHFWIRQILQEKCPEALLLTIKDQEENPEDKISLELWRNIYQTWINFHKTIQLPKTPNINLVNELLKYTETERITCVDVWGKKRNKIDPQLYH